MKIFTAIDNYPANGCEAIPAQLPSASAAHRAAGAAPAAQPIVCLKADSALLKGRKPFFVPTFMGRIGYGAHVVVRISRLGKTVSERFAHRYYDALTVGVGFTALDVLDRCRREGLPWDVAEGFDGAAVIGDWVATDKLLNPQAVRFRLDINGQTVQQASACEMLHRIDRLIAHVSQFYTLKMGDLLYTGTPAGTGEIHIGDHVEGFLEDRPVLTFACK